MIPRITLAALVALLVSVCVDFAGSANAAVPSSQCANLGDGYRHCYSIAVETTQPNGGSATWIDANYNPNCSTHAFIIQDLWFLGPYAPDGGVQWSEFGHQSCKNLGGEGGQYWVIFTSLWSTSCNCRIQGYLWRHSVTAEQVHRYEIRTNGNGTQTFQIDTTQIWTGSGYGEVPFGYTSGLQLQSGVEAVVLPTANVFPLSGRTTYSLTVIPASCGCNNVYVPWSGSGHPADCNNPNASNPDICVSNSPLNGKAYASTTYSYWGE